MAAVTPLCGWATFCHHSSVEGPMAVPPALCCGSAAVHLGVRASESLLSVPWGGDPEVGLPKRIVILC